MSPIRGSLLSADWFSTNPLTLLGVWINDVIDWIWSVYHSLFPSKQTFKWFSFKYVSCNPYCLNLSISHCIYPFTIFSHILYFLYGSRRIMPVTASIWCLLQLYFTSSSPSSWWCYSIQGFASLHHVLMLFISVYHH